MNKVKFNLHAPLGKLEQLKNCRYSPGDISIASNARISRQAIHKILNTQMQSVSLDTIGAILDFFSAEGMPITIDQLFTVQEEGVTGREPGQPTSLTRAKGQVAR